MPDDRPPDDAFYRGAEDPEVKVVGRVVAEPELEAETERLALRIAGMPAFGPALTERAVHQAEDLQGLHPGMDAVFGPHHLAHPHNAETAADSLGGVDIAALKEANT
ncbi:hypothetical protein ACGFYY_37005 [Streptomyces sp. NPDC048331]|uniref:hypothetical protein n=1 Tax=Streptomyces sp. NPDC048331 TaxID=3365534 RepID=UPI0037116F23